MLVEGKVGNYRGLEKRHIIKYSKGEDHKHETISRKERGKTLNAAKARAEAYGPSQTRHTVAGGSMRRRRGGISGCRWTP